MGNSSAIKKIVAVVLIGMFFTTAVVFKIKNNKADANESSTKLINKTEVSAAPKINTAEYASLFKKDTIIDIKIDIAEDDFKSILDNPTAEEYRTANVTINGTTVKNVGFRAKGNLTLKSVASSDSDRFSFKIKTDEFVDDQTLLGLDEFVVNNMYSDPSYLREYLSYEALRQIGEDVPETVFANIYINGKLYGFYLCVEAVDDSFLKRTFGDNDGNLYRGDQGSSLQYIEGSNYDSLEIKSGGDDTKTDLKNFIKVLNEMKSGNKGDIETVLDVDSALRYLAANTVMGSNDSYSGHLAQNYYLYGYNGKMTVIPWDYNMSFEGYHGETEQTTIPIDEPVMGVNMASRPLINNLLAVEEYKNKYHEYINQLLNYLDSFESRVTELANIIRPYVESDPSKFCTMEQFEASIKYVTTSGSALTKANVNAESSTVKGRANTNFGGKMKGGPGAGMGATGNSISIVNFIRDRVANIKKQLSGELPTTGNMTMNDTKGRNR